MRALRLLGIILGGTLLALMLIAGSVIFSLPVERWDGLIRSHVYAQTGLDLNADWDRSWLQLRGTNATLKKDKQAILVLDEIAMGPRLLPLLTGKLSASLALLDRRGGSFEFVANRSFRQNSFVLDVERFSLAPLNGILEAYGARVTGVVHASVDVTSPVSAPGALNGPISVEIPGLKVDGGPLLRGLGIDMIEYSALSGRGSFSQGVMSNFEADMRGDDVYGTAKVEIRIQPDMQHGQWSAEPKIKFSEAMLGTIGNMLPLSGLVRDAQGNYTRRFKGAW